MTRRERTLAITTAVALMLIAAALRLTTYDRFLPMLDYSDETNMFLLALDMRGDEVPLAEDYGARLTGEWLAGYPPLHPWLGVWTGRALEANADHFLFPGDYIGTMRLLSVVANIATVGVLFALGWTLTAEHGATWGTLGGALTALPYALSPQIIDIGNLAIPDSLIPLGCALALLGAARAITADRPAWLVVGLLGAVAAIYLKYSVLVGLWAFFCAVIVLVRRRGFRPMLPWLLLLAVISAATGGYLLWDYGALGLENREAANFRETGLANMFNLDRNRVNFLTALRISVAPLLFLVSLVAGAFASWRNAGNRINWRWLWILVPFIVGNILLTSSVVYADPQFGGYGRVRFVFPAAIALSAIWGMALVELARELRWRRLGLVLVGVSVAVIAIPALRADAALFQHYRTAHTTQLLWQYTDASIPNTGTILTPRDSRVHLTWNRPYSGYTGDTPFAWTYDNAPYNREPSDFIADGIHYFAVTEVDLVTYLAVPEMDHWLDQLYPLKRIEPDGETISGQVTLFYRMTPPQNAADVRFGERIRMVGYDLNTTDIAPGGELRFRPYWGADTTPQAAYSVSVRLTPADEPETVIAQQDGSPASATRPTLTWDDPAENIIGTEAVLTIPPETPPGNYTLSVILYDYQTGTRLPVGNADQYNLTIITK